MRIPKGFLNASPLNGTKKVLFGSGIFKFVKVTVGILALEPISAEGIDKSEVNMFL